MRCRLLAVLLIAPGCAQLLGLDEPASGSVDAGSGSDGGTAPDAALHRLDVDIGLGGGTVESDPPGINCGSSCSAEFEAGTMVTLTANPGPAASFAGWSGACDGPGPCVVTMNAGKSVAAGFGYALTVAQSGSSTGVVTSDPAGITCGPACSAIFPPGTMVTLTADGSATGARFAGWSGACSSGAPCTLLMNTAYTVGARFEGGGVYWAQSFGSTAVDSVSERGLAVDPATGDHVLGLSLFGPAVVGGTLVTPPGPRSGVVARFDSTGALLWLRQIGETGVYAHVASTTFDSTGAVVATGYAGNPVDFGDGVLRGGTDHGWIARYSAGGSLIWVRTIPTAGITVAMAQAGGDVLVAGRVGGTIDFGGGPSTGGPGDGFVARYDGVDGALVWVRRVTPSNTNDFLFADLLTDPGTGDVIVGGFGSNGTIDLGGGPHIVTANTAAFVARYGSASGAHQWSTWATGGTSRVTALGQMSDGRLLASGYFQNTCSFGGPTVVSLGGSDLFMVHLSEGGVPQSLRRWGDAEEDQVRGMAVTSADEILVTGRFLGTVDLGVGPFLATSFDGFVMKLDAAGNTIWADHLSGGGEESGVSIAVHSGGLLVAGGFSSTVEVDATMLTTSGDHDVFVFSLGQ